MNATRLAVVGIVVVAVGLGAIAVGLFKVASEEKRANCIDAVHIRYSGWQAPASEFLSNRGTEATLKRINSEIGRC